MGEEGAKKLDMRSKPFSFTATSKLIRSANSPFQVWKSPQNKKNHDYHVDKEHNNKLFEHQLCIPNTCNAQTTNNKVNIMGNPNPDQAEKIIIKDSLLTPDIGFEKSSMPFKPISFMAPSNLVRSASSSFQVWKNPNDKKIHAFHVDQGKNNNQLEHQLGIPNTCCAQTTNNKINILGEPNSDQATTVNDSLLALDVGVEKSGMPFSFMGPSKLVGSSSSSSFQAGKNPNEKKSHDDHVDKGHNNQKLKFHLGILSTCYAQATNNKINIMGKPNSNQAEKTVINDSLLTLDVGFEKSIMFFKPFSFMHPSKLLRSANSSFQVWKSPNKKMTYDDQRNNNQQLDHQLGIPNICYAQATNNNINIVGNPNPDQAGKTINDSLLTLDVGVEKSIMPFNRFSFMAPSKLVRSASSAFQVWKNPNDKKSHDYDVDQGNNNQQLEHRLGILNTCYAQATNNKINILVKPYPYQAEKTIINDSLLTPDVGVEKSIMPFKPFSFIAPSKLVRSSRSSFQVWKKPNEKKSHDGHVDQGNNNQQLEHQFSISNICYAQATNNKNKIAEKPNVDHAEKTIISDSLSSPDVGVSLINTNQNCESKTTKSICLDSDLDINKEDPKVLKRLAYRAYSKNYRLKKTKHITNLEKTTKKLRRNIYKIRYKIKHNCMMKRELLIENHQLKSHIYLLEMNRLHKEDEIAKNMEEVQRLKWLESNIQACVASSSSIKQIK